MTAPLNLPNTNIASITLRARVAAAGVESPFTFHKQIQVHQGQLFQAQVTLPIMKRDVAEAWLAFFLSLNGPEGTFLMGDPAGAIPRGSAAQTPGTPQVKGAGQLGNQLVVDGLPASADGYLKAGDYIQLGTGATSRLHKVTADIDTNGSGEATIKLWPYITVAPADNATVVVSNAKGVFRLDSNMHEWNINEASHYTTTFSASGVV